MLQLQERVGVDFTAVFPEQFAEVVVLGQQRHAIVNASSEELVGQRLNVVARFVLK